MLGTLRLMFQDTWSYLFIRSINRIGDARAETKNWRFWESWSYSYCLILIIDAISSSVHTIKVFFQLELFYLHQVDGSVLLDEWHAQQGHRALLCSWSWTEEYIWTKRIHDRTGGVFSCFLIARVNFFFWFATLHGLIPLFFVICWLSLLHILKCLSLWVS